MSTPNNITKAKSVLVIEQPFFASIFLSLPMREDNSIPTMATDGDEIRYNSEFMSKLTLSETVFILAHETLHCVFQHMTRRGTRNANRWNIAADYIINDLLVSEKIGSVIKGALIDSLLVKQGKNTTEGVYDLLPESDGDKNAGDIFGGGSLDEVEDAGKDPIETSQKENEMRVKIVQAANAAKMQGKLSANMTRIVGELTASRVDWRSVLRRFLSDKAKVDLSYAKPKRRFLAEDFYLPSLVGEKLGTIVVAVDCSGSVDEKLLTEFSNEIKAIVSDVSPSMTHVIYFDSEVLNQTSFGPDDDVVIKPHGGGGTAFSPIFKHIDKSNLEPMAVVILTDLECSDFGSEPSYPVMWAATQKGNAPFGETLLIKNEK